jgi:hypothetical protein
VRAPNVTKLSTDEYGRFRARFRYLPQINKASPSHLNTTCTEIPQRARKRTIVPRKKTKKTKKKKKKIRQNGDVKRIHSSNLYFAFTALKRKVLVGIHGITS